MWSSPIFWCRNGHHPQSTFVFFYLFRRNKRNKRSQRTTLRHQLNLLWGINNWMYIRAICAVPRRRHPCNNISHEADCTFFDFVSTMYEIRRRLQMFLLVPPYTFPVARSMIQWFNSIGWYSIFVIMTCFISIDRLVSPWPLVHVLVAPSAPSVRCIIGLERNFANKSWSKRIHCELNSNFALHPFTCSTYRFLRSTQMQNMMLIRYWCILNWCSI